MWKMFESLPESGPQNSMTSVTAPSAPSVMNAFCISEVQHNAKRGRIGFHLNLLSPDTLNSGYGHNIWTSAHKAKQNGIIVFCQIGEVNSTKQTQTKSVSQVLLSSYSKTNHKLEGLNPDLWNNKQCISCTHKLSGDLFFINNNHKYSHVKRRRKCWVRSLPYAAGYPCGIYYTLLHTKTQILARFVISYSMCHHGPHISSLLTFHSCSGARPTMASSKNSWTGLEWMGKKRGILFSALLKPGNYSMFRFCMDTGVGCVQTIVSSAVKNKKKLHYKSWVIKSIKWDKLGRPLGLNLGRHRVCRQQRAKQKKPINCKLHTWQPVHP